jgi:hypothetical protein
VTPLWTFSAQVSPSRVAALQQHQDFAKVVELVAKAAVTAFVWESFRGEALRGCRRATFQLQVTPETYDAFFNAPVGLRAQFAKSPYHGEAANRRMLNQLEPRLLAYASLTENNSEPVRWSLSASQAKLWIDEDEVQSQLGESEAAIVYPPWAERSESGVGLLAPQGRRLVVMGGWLSSSGVVTDNPAKAGRSAELHLCGYT